MQQTAADLIEDLLLHANESKALTMQRFFKDKKDNFMGVSMPTIRKAIKPYLYLPYHQVSQLIKSKTHEVRMSGFLLLVEKYKKKKQFNPAEVVQHYLDHLEYANSWDLVDASCIYILGVHLINKDHDLLFDLAASPNLWFRRVSAVSCIAFIRKHKFETTLSIAITLGKDQEDLVQKAVGWILRESIKKEPLHLDWLRSNLQHFLPKIISIAIQDQAPHTKAEIRQLRNEE